MTFPLLNGGLGDAMRADIVDGAWQRRLALRALACALSELKCLAAETRLERAMWRHALALRIASKAGFKPDQPRVPKGDPGGGQWTGGAGTAGGSNPPTTGTTGGSPDVPSQRPPLSADRTAVLKRVARWRGPLATIAESLYGAASWIHEYHAKIDSYRDPPKSMQELQDAVSPKSKAGYQDHHIVERTSAARDGGFPQSMIEDRENVVRIPTMRHEDINAWYQKHSARYGDMSPREYLRDKSWEERRQVGIDALIENGVLKP